MVEGGGGGGEHELREEVFMVVKGAFEKQTMEELEGFGGGFRQLEEDLNLAGNHPSAIHNSQFTC